MASDRDGPQVTVLLGPEYDDALRTELMAVLREMAAIARRQPTWDLAGAQEIEAFDVEVDGAPLLIEAETYLGLSITGSRDLVGKIQSAVESRRGSPSRSTG